MKWLLYGVATCCFYLFLMGSVSTVHAESRIGMRCIQPSISLSIFNIRFFTPYRYFQIRMTEEGQDYKIGKVYDLEHVIPAPLTTIEVTKHGSWYSTDLYIQELHQMHSVIVEVFFSTSNQPMLHPVERHRLHCFF